MYYMSKGLKKRIEFRKVPRYILLFLHWRFICGENAAQSNQATIVIKEMFVGEYSSRCYRRIYASCIGRVIIIEESRELPL